MMLPAGDTRLLAQMAAGSYDAFTQLYNHFIKSLIWYGLRFTTDKELVEDALHETFTWIWNHRTSLQIHSSLKAYLFQSMRFNVLAKVNRQRRTSPIDAEEEDNSFPFDLAISPEKGLIEKEETALLRQKMHSLISRLTSRQKEVIYMRYYEDIPFDDIAASLNLTVKATYKLMGRAIAALRELVQEQHLAAKWLLLVWLTRFIYYHVG